MFIDRISLSYNFCEIHQTFPFRKNYLNFRDNRKFSPASAPICSCLIVHIQYCMFAKNKYFLETLQKSQNGPFISYLADKFCLFCNNLKENSTFVNFCKNFRQYFREKFRFHPIFVSKYTDL
jgi:hypothetical protein